MEIGFFDRYSYLAPVVATIGSGAIAASCAYFWRQSKKKEKVHKQAIIEHDSAINEFDRTTKAKKPIPAEIVSKVKAAMHYVQLPKASAEELEKKIDEYNKEPKNSLKRAQMLNIIDAQLGEKERATLARIDQGDFIAHQQKERTQTIKTQTKIYKVGATLSGAASITSSLPYWYDKPFAWMAAGFGALSLAAGYYTYKSQEAEERAKTLDDAHDRISAYTFEPSLTTINDFARTLRNERIALNQWNEYNEAHERKRGEYTPIDFKLIAWNDDLIEKAKQAFEHIKYPFLVEFNKDFAAFTKCEPQEKSQYIMLQQKLMQHVIDATGSADNIVTNMRTRTCTKMPSLQAKQQRKTTHYKLATYTSTFLTGLCVAQCVLFHNTSTKT